jgi:hypothetical protein
MFCFAAGGCRKHQGYSENVLHVLWLVQEVHPRGSYASAADRLKLALLPHIPGRLALVIHADIMARHMLHQAFQVTLCLEGHH